MRLIVLAMLLACALVASTNRVRRQNPFEKGDRKRPEPTKGPDLEGEDSNRPRDRRASSLEEQANLHEVERRSPPQKWAGNFVCYYFADGLNDDNMKKNLRRAMDEMEKNSCVNFIEADTGNPECTTTTKPKLLVKNDDVDGCWADFGCHSSMNRINVPTQCDVYDQIGVLMHELFHALGRYHEHNRPDRDQFVTVHWDNIKAGREHNFEKKPAGEFETYGLRYDYLSIMHYGERFFSEKDTSVTLEVKDPDFKSKAGQQKLLSTSDVVYLNNMYECYKTHPNPCEHRGARRDDGSCYCIHPFTGDNCEEVLDGVTVVTNNGSEAITVDSPNFPGLYPQNTITEILLECTNTAEKVQLDFKAFEVEGLDCHFDKFRFTILTNDPYPNVECGDALRGKIIESRSNSMMISLESDDYMNYQGFDSVFTCV